MNFLVFLVASLSLILTVQPRGPHHPRGSVKKHAHYHPTKNSDQQKLTQDDNLLHDKEHLQEHLDDSNVSPDLSKMSDEELEFYYFQVHDTDKNSQLDGLEILQAIFHTTDHSDHKEILETENENTTLNEKSYNEPDESYDFDYYIELIDRVLQEDDLDKNGLLSYIEYAQGRKKTIKDQSKPSVQMV